MASELEIVASGDEVVIRKLERVLDAESLFVGKTPEEWRKAYGDAFDWGPDEGRERPEE